MKKRLLLLLALGVSFAPPVFAEGKGESYALGELKISQTDLRGANCPFQGLKNLPVESQDTPQKADSSSSASGRAL